MTKIVLACAVAALAVASVPSMVSAQEAGVPNPAIVGLWGGDAPPPVDEMGRTRAQQLAPGEQLIGFGAVAAAADSAQNLRYEYMGNTGARKWITFEQDGGIGYRDDLPKPLYKPEFWDDIRNRDLYANAGGEYLEFVDPIWDNYPAGLARVNNPTQIVQGRDENELIFLYGGGNQYRIIQVGTAPNCPPHDEALQYDQLFWGNGVGCWQADGTLKVNTMGLAGDKMWMNNQGTFMTNEVMIDETFTVLTGQGENKDQTVLARDIIITDPNVLLEPFVKGRVRNTLNTNREAIIVEDVPYREKSLGALFDPLYRG
jgi:hypothetical protein